MVGGLAGINLYVTWICGRRFFSHPIARWRSCRTLPSYYTMPLNRGIYYVMPFGPRTQPRLPHNEFLVCLSDCLFASLAPVCFFPTPHPPSLSVFFPQQSVFFPQQWPRQCRHQYRDRDHHPCRSTHLLLLLLQLQPLCSLVTEQLMSFSIAL